MLLQPRGGGGRGAEGFAMLDEAQRPPRVPPTVMRAPLLIVVCVWCVCVWCVCVCVWCVYVPLQFHD